MSQSAVIGAVIVGAFVLYLARNDRLRTYLAVVGL
jgi:hypothetical protein